MALDEPRVAAGVGAVGVVRAGLSALVALGEHVPGHLVSHALVKDVVDTLFGFEEGGEFSSAPQDNEREGESKRVRKTCDCCCFHNKKGDFFTGWMDRRPADDFVEQVVS